MTTINCHGGEYPITTYANDERDRLVGEHRSGTRMYRMTHTYDGNQQPDCLQNSVAPFTTTTSYDPVTRIVTYVHKNALATCPYSVSGNLTLDTGQEVTIGV